MDVMEEMKERYGLEEIVPGLWVTKKGNLLVSSAKSWKELVGILREVVHFKRSFAEEVGDENLLYIARVSVNILYRTIRGSG